MKQSLTKTVFLLVNSFFILVYVFLMLLIQSHTLLIDNQSLMTINGIGGYLFLFWMFYTHKKLKDEFISFYIVFMVIMIVFTYSQSLLYPFNRISETKNLLNIVTEVSLISAQAYTLLSYFIIHFGALITFNKVNYNKIMIKDDNTALKSLFITGLLLFFISLPAFIVNVYTLSSVVSSYGYRALFGYDGIQYVNHSLLVRVLLSVEGFFIPSLLLLYIGSPNKNYKKASLILFTVYILVTLFIGGRSDAAVLVASIGLLMYYRGLKINKRKLIYYGIILYLFLSILPVIAIIRDQANRTFFDYFVLYFSNLGNTDLLSELFSELGGSMFPVIKVMEKVPILEPYNLGKSYYYGVLSIVPNLGFWDIHPSQIYANGSSWLMNVLNLNYGPGFSMQAEVFWNFGWFGLILFVPIGLLLGKVFGSISKKKYNIVALSMMLIIFSETVLVVRGEILTLTRPLFYTVLPIYILFSIIQKSNVSTTKANRIKLKKDFYEYNKQI